MINMPKAVPKPKLSINVGASLRCTNGVDVSVDPQLVTLTMEGPRGGAGSSISIPLGDWDALAETVGLVRAAITKADAILKEENIKP